MEEFGQDFIQGMKSKLDIELIGVVSVQALQVPKQGEAYSINKFACRTYRQAGLTCSGKGCEFWRKPAVCCWKTNIEMFKYSNI